MKKIVMIISLILLFSACSTKELVYIKAAKYQFQIPKEIKAQRFSIKANQKTRYKKYIQALRARSKFLEEQIKDYYENK